MTTLFFDEPTILNLFIIIIDAICLIFLFKIKIKLKEEFSEAFTFLIIGVIIGIFLRIMSFLNILDVVINDILVASFEVFLLIFLLKMYYALLNLTNKRKNEQNQTQQSKKISRKANISKVELVYD